MASSSFFTFPFPKHTLRNLIVANSSSSSSSSSSPNTNTLNKPTNGSPPPVLLKTKLNKHGNSVWLKPCDVAQENDKKKRVKADVELPQVKMRVGLDMCSKRGDVIGAISFYDSALSGNVKLDQYHFTVLLYLCSSAAVGLVRPAKSGSTVRTTLDAAVDSSPAMWFSNGFVKRNSRALDNLNNNHNDEIIRVSEDVRKYALERGFEIYDKMREEGVAMNEAALTSVARMAMATGDGETAFAMVKEMKRMGIKPRLRSYGPALSAFCGSGDIHKAFDVERHMLENGVYPEEPELEALLRVSVGARKGDKVYYMLHKLRTSVRRVSPSTAELIVKWFESKEASRVGKTKYDERLIREAMENGGGGWHGQGWLGKGKWSVLRTTIGSDGLCKCCGGKLATIDLDPVETENFAESVASIAIKRERNSSFQKFQKWLDYYGPFEAVVDAANVGLFSQKKFIPSKVNAVVNGIRQKLPSKRWPLIVLHNRRLVGGRMDERVNKALVEKWQTADALYATPTGSNDDWYWLYAAIKFKCLLVTNDEMRDHTFQLLGNDFFPRWKERHQVHFSFSEGGPVFHMPPPCSVVIQESEEGHWHIPVESEHGYEAERMWLCIMRSKFREATNDSTTRPKDNKLSLGNKSVSTSAMRTSIQQETLTTANHKYSKDRPQEILKSLKDIVSGSTLSNHRSILPEIESAENIAGCTIDFQI